MSKLHETVKLTKALIEQKKSIEKAGADLGLDPLITWVMYLEGSSDKERLELISKKTEGLKCDPRPYDVWNFAESVARSLLGT